MVVSDGGTPNATKISWLCRMDLSSFSRPCRDVWIEARSRERILAFSRTFQGSIPRTILDVPRIDPWNVLEIVLGIDPWNVLETRVYVAVIALRSKHRDTVVRTRNDPACTNSLFLSRLAFHIRRPQKHSHYGLLGEHAPRPPYNAVRYMHAKEQQQQHQQQQQQQQQKKTARAARAAWPHQPHTMCAPHSVYIM